MANKLISQVGSENATPAATSFVELETAAGVSEHALLSAIRTLFKTTYDTLYNLYVHPNHSGDVTSIADGATTIADNAVTLAKLATQAANTILAEVTGSTAVPTAVAVAANKFLARASTGNIAAKDITDFMLTLMDDADAATFMSTLGLTANGQSLVTAANYAAMKALLDLEIGTDVQAYDADLTTWAGKTAPSGTVLGTTDVQTVTNTRFNPRVVTTTDDATAVIDCDVTDQYQLTAIANATTFSVTGTPVNGQRMLIRWKDAGAAKGLTWDAVFRAIGVTLPTTTVISKTGYVLVVYNSADSKWDALAVGVEA